MLVCFAEFLNRTCVPAVFAEFVAPVTRKSTLYTVTDYVMTVILSVALGCDYNVDINYMLRPYPQVARLLGMRGIPEQSAVSRFYHALTVTTLEELDIVWQVLQQQLGCAREEPSVDIDIDTTGLAVYGSTYEGAAKGYFPRQRGKKGYQLGLVTTSPQGEALSDCFLPGNLRPEGLLVDLVYGAAEALGSLERIGLVTLDAGYGTEMNLAQLKEYGLAYIAKGRDPRSFSRTSKALPEHEWQYAGPNNLVCELGVQRVTQRAETTARTILLRFTNAKGQLEFGHLCTCIPEEEMAADQVFERYNRREQIEAVNNIIKNTLRAKHLRNRSSTGIAGFLKLSAITLNLLHAFRRMVLAPAGMGDLGIHDIVHRLMTIPGKMNQRGRHVRLEMPADHPMTTKVMVAANVVSSVSCKS